MGQSDGAEGDPDSPATLPRSRTISLKRSTHLEQTYTPGPRIISASAVTFPQNEHMSIRLEG